MSVAGRPRAAPALAEGELVERARRGDLSAYEEIVRRHQTVAFRVAYVICASREDAEEATQDAFVKAHAALARFRSGAPLRPWLLRIAANEARNRRTSVARRAALSLRLAQDAASTEAVPSPEGSTMLGAERRELIDALGRLPRKYRHVIALRYLLDLSEMETAAAMGCRRGTVKSRTARALARLRLELEGPHA